MRIFWKKNCKNCDSVGDSTLESPFVLVPQTILAGFRKCKKGGGRGNYLGIRFYELAFSL